MAVIPKGVTFSVFRSSDSGEIAFFKDKDGYFHKPVLSGNAKQRRLINRKFERMGYGPVRGTWRAIN